jgi:hypothetical protein
MRTRRDESSGLPSSLRITSRVGSAVVQAAVAERMKGSQRGAFDQEAPARQRGPLHLVIFRSVVDSDLDRVAEARPLDAAIGRQEPVIGHRHQRRYTVQRAEDLVSILDELVYEVEAAAACENQAIRGIGRRLVVRFGIQPVTVPAEKVNWHLGIKDVIQDVRRIVRTRPVTLVRVNGDAVGEHEMEQRDDDVSLVRVLKAGAMRHQAFEVIRHGDAPLASFLRAEQAHHPADVTAKLLLVVEVVVLGQRVGGIVAFVERSGEDGVRKIHIRGELFYHAGHVLRSRSQIHGLARADQPCLAARPHAALPR